NFEAFPSVAGHPAVTGALKLKRHSDPEALLQSSRKAAKKSGKADPKSPSNAGKPVAMLDSIRSVIESKNQPSAAAKDAKSAAKKQQPELAKSAS
ncbi:MAG: hypothetical protein AAGH89_03120, partial [Verrucomicrobiota bacterium]